MKTRPRRAPYSSILLTPKMDPTSSNSSSYSSPELTNQSTRKAQSLEDILHEFGSIQDVSYTPFKIEARRLAEALLPADFPANPHPYDYFAIFFTPNLFRTITTNINQYANI
jgi:hypothetical protein